MIYIYNTELNICILLNVSICSSVIDCCLGGVLLLFFGGEGVNKLVNKLDHKSKENSFKPTLYSVPIDRACVASVFVIPFKCLGIDIQREHTLSQYVSCMLSLLSSWLQKLVWSTHGHKYCPSSEPRAELFVWGLEYSEEAGGLWHAASAWWLFEAKIQF